MYYFSNVLDIYHASSHLNRKNRSLGRALRYPHEFYISLKIKKKIRGDTSGRSATQVALRQARFVTFYYLPMRLPQLANQYYLDLRQHKSQALLALDYDFLYSKCQLLHHEPRNHA